MIEAVDLFCGAGGLTAGLRQSGIKVKAGYDIEESCSYAYEFNNKAKFINKDVSTVTKKEIDGWYTRGAVRLLAGCAPCQPFSKYNQGRDTRQDVKWPLLYAFSRLIKESNPELVTMENVPDVTKHEVYHDFVKGLEDQGYYVWASKISCDHYGLPQHRNRHVLLASRLGPIELIGPTHIKNPVTVRKAIGHLPAISSGETFKQDDMHKAAKLSELNLKRIRHSKPGGSWKDWPKELITACHNKDSGKTYVSVYGRMEWNKPSPTMTTLCCGYGNGRFGHPEQDRPISLREAALLQGFPNDYRFVAPNKPVYISSVSRMIGNAVPVTLGTVIGKSLINHIYEKKDFNNQMFSTI